MRYRSTFYSEFINSSIKVSYCQAHRLNQSVDLKVLKENLDALRMDAKSSEYLVILSKKSSQIKELAISFKEYLDQGLLIIATYESIAETRLLNLSFGLIQGAAVVSLGPGDYLAPRMTTYIYKELSTLDEKSFVFEKKHKIPVRLALWRSTFYEIGGFDESVKPVLQVRNLIDRLDMIGVYNTRKVHDHLTRTKEIRSRSFRLFKAKKLKLKLKLEFERPNAEEFEWLV